jgi:O-6-methylguanine DNA methyltransferase
MPARRPITDSSARPAVGAQHTLLLTASPAEGTGAHLWRAATEWQRQARAALEPLGLTHAQFLLLASAAWHTRDRHAPPLTQAMLGADTGVDPAMTSEVLRTLEDRALLTRVPHPEDGRARAIRVTAAGRRAAQRAVQAVERVDADYFGAPSEALRALRRRLDADVRSPARDASIERERAFHGETAASESLRYASMNSRYGRVLMAASTQGVCFAQFGENEAALLRALHDSFPDAVLNAAPEGDMLHDWLQSYASYLAGASQRPAFPLALPGTPLQQAVWAYLQSLPRGATVTYTDVARGVGRPSAVRAVASACGANRVAVLVPCHRVVRTDGGLGGYRWGLDRKRALLEAEGATLAA